MANVFSYVYKVDDDLKKISGVSHGETVEIFLANLIKADTGQLLRVPFGYVVLRNGIIIDMMFPVKKGRVI